MPETPEQLARKQIGAPLTACSWVVHDDKAADFSTGPGIALREVPLATGPCDDLLLTDRKALGVVEAKKLGSTLSTVASSLPAVLADDLVKVPRPLRPIAIRRRRTRRGGEADTFCNATMPRIAVTMDMIATGTDITAMRGSAFLKSEAILQSPARVRDNPLEVLIFLRDPALRESRVYFEQMKGRGTRVVTPTDLQSVSGEDARAKTRFNHDERAAVTEGRKHYGTHSNCHSRGIGKLCEHNRE